MADSVPLFEIAWDKDDIVNAVDSIGRGSYWAKGPYVTEFEEELEQYLGVEHVVTVNSGTTALVTALRAHGIGDGDEVIVPPFTFIATANAVELAGATPVFADIERETYGLDPEAVSEAITSNTKAIMPVHVYGSPCRIDELRAVADEHDLLLIEDAAAALGSELNDENVLTFGDSAITSFCQNKIITTGEGGAVVTDDDEVAENARLIRSHGRVAEDYFDSAGSGQYVALGSNYRLSDMAAAVGCAQLGKIEDNIEGRRDAAARMTDGFEAVGGVTPVTGHPDGGHVYQIYTISLGDGIDRKAIIDDLADRDIASKVYWDPIHTSEYYRSTYGYEVGDFPIAEDIASRVLSLPMYPDLSDADADRIVAAVEENV